MFDVWKLCRFFSEDYLKNIGFTFSSLHLTGANVWCFHDLQDVCCCMFVASVAHANVIGGLGVTLKLACGSGEL